MMAKDQSAPENTVLLTLTVVARVGGVQIIDLQQPNLSEFDRQITAASLRDYADKLEKK
jgi:hypothetical protein